MIWKTAKFDEQKQRKLKTEISALLTEFKHQSIHWEYQSRDCAEEWQLRRVAKGARAGTLSPKRRRRVNLLMAQVEEHTMHQTHSISPAQLLRPQRTHSQMLPLRQLEQMHLLVMQMLQKLLNLTVVLNSLTKSVLPFPLQSSLALSELRLPLSVLYFFLFLPFPITSQLL